MTTATRGMRDSDIAKAINVSASTISRWRSGDSFPKPRQVVQFARTFSINPLAALVAADYLDQDDLDGASHVHVAQGAEGLSMMELIEEIQIRADNMGTVMQWIKAIADERDSTTASARGALTFADPYVAPAEADTNGFPEQVVRALAPHLQRVGDMDGIDMFSVKARAEPNPVVFPPFGERPSFEELDTHRSVAKKNATEEELDPDAD